MQQIHLRGRQLDWEAFENMYAALHLNCILGEPNCPVEMTGEKYDVGDVVVVVFAFMTAGLNLSELGPSIEKITAGRQAAKRIFSVIDREPAVKNCENPKRI